jgi:hypothetical protein
MIYMLQVPSLQKFKDNFFECKEVKIGESKVLHITKDVFFMFIMSNLNRQNSNLFRVMQEILHNYNILQIEEI